MEPDKTSIPQELEVKLIVIHPNPAQIAEEISRLDHLSEYKLVSHAQKQIHDIYFDTADEIFRRKRLAMRLRNENNQYFITVKGKTKVHEWGGVERLEIENPWSVELFRDILLNLEIYGIKLQEQRELQDSDKPLEILEKFGLLVIQDRRTERLTRQISSRNEKIAELAIDKVTFSIKNRNLIHYEIEAEAKDTAGNKAIQDIQLELQSTFGDALRLSAFSKLMLGMVLAEIPDNPEYFNEHKSETYLSQAAYDWIEQKLKTFKE
jgi:inorganic triphosphatase YgiF